MTKKLMLSTALVSLMALASTANIAFASDKEELFFKDEVGMQKELEIKQQELQGNLPAQDIKLDVSPVIVDAEMLGRDGKNVIANPDLDRLPNLRGIADFEAAGFDKKLLEDVKGFENSSAADPLGRGADQFESAGQRANRAGQDIAANPFSNGRKAPAAPNTGLGLVSVGGTLPGNHVDTRTQSSVHVSGDAETGVVKVSTVTATASTKEVNTTTITSNGIHQSTLTTHNTGGSTSGHYTESTSMFNGTHHESEAYQVGDGPWVGQSTQTSPDGQVVVGGATEDEVKPGQRHTHRDCADLDCGSGDNYYALAKAFGKKRADAMMAERRKAIRQGGKDQVRPAEQSSGEGDKVTVELSKWDVLGNPGLEEHQSRGGGKDLRNIGHDHVNPGNPNAIEDLF